MKTLRKSIILRTRLEINAIKCRSANKWHRFKGKRCFFVTLLEIPESIYFIYLSYLSKDVLLSSIEVNIKT